MEKIIEVVEEITPDRVELVLIDIEKSGGHHGHRHPHLCFVKIDSKDRQIHPGRYKVSVLKRALGVDPAYELEQIEAGKLVPLADDGHIRVHCGEQFVSHVRSGASS